VINPYHSEPAKITKITPQTSSIKLFRFEFEQKIWGYNFAYRPGQFIELSLPGFGEAPFAPCGAPGEKYIELCIREVGPLTGKMHLLKIGDRVGIRGPYGRDWPSACHCEERNETKQDSADQSSARNNNYLIVVGGLGLVPLRTLILGKDRFLGKNAKLQIFYGAKSPEEMLFRSEFDQWRQSGVDLNLTIDQECSGWIGCVGLVTALFGEKDILPNPKVLLCGPPIMFKFVLLELQKKGIPDQDIFLSLERRMHCGFGVCQHCGIGPYYICKDGPVFRYDEIKDISGAI